MMRILFLAANPTTSDPLRLPAELRRIQAKIDASEKRADLQLTSIFAVSRHDLLDQLNKIRPQIIHFSGHGEPTGELVLESENGEAEVVNPAALKAVFELFRPELQVVVLNACYSAAQATAFVDIVDAVIAMNNTISDTGAIVFAAAFYSALGFGRSISDAFNQGKVAMLLEGVADADVPTLLHRLASDPSKLTVCTSREYIVSADPDVPLRLRRLLDRGARLVVLADSSQVEADELIYFELALRQSNVSYVVQVSRYATIEKTAEALAGTVISHNVEQAYKWHLIESGNEAASPFGSSLTIEMAGIKSGARLLLFGEPVYEYPANL